MDVREFFSDLLKASLASLKVSAGIATESYLADLLAGFATPDGGKQIETPLVDQLGCAVRASAVERPYRFRLLGDSALFIAGFASDCLSKKGVSKSYCITMGSRAYREAGNQGSPVLLELSDHFESFVFVLDEVRERTVWRTDGDVLRLYQRWEESGSPELLLRLGKIGIAPLSNRSKA